MKTEDLYENILATSIRMYSLYQAALSLCSVKTLEQLIEQLLIHCVTAMDIATTCLMTKDGAMHVRGAELRDSDETYLREQLSQTAEPWIHDRLPSDTTFLAASIQRENDILGMLVAMDKEGSEFEPTDFVRMGELATITATALANVYEYAALIERTERADEQLNFISEREA